MTIEVKTNSKGQKAMIVDGNILGVSDDKDNPISPYMKFIIAHIDGMTICSKALFLGGGPMLLSQYFANNVGDDGTTYENDEKVYELAKENWPNIQRCKVKLSNALTFDETYLDLIVLDIHGNGPVEKFYNADFYVKCKKALAPKGTFVVNWLPATREKKEAEEFGKLLATVFPNVTMQGLYHGDKGLAQGVFFCSGTGGLPHEQER